jgi:GTPase SAR1 family protein
MKQRKKFIAVIGNSNAGKSTVIISLTGCHSRSFRDLVTDRLSNESVYVIASSPQEQDLSSEEYRGILAQVIQNDNCRGLVMAIQPTKSRVRLSLEDMVREVQDRNAFESYLFVLEPGRNDPDEAQGILNNVNQRLENTGLVAQGLDGRRFAFLNARHINQVSQMF